jgi:hypothetical protein
MERSVWRHGAFYAVALTSLMTSVLVVSSAGAASGVPSVPRAVHASGTATSIDVRWSRPASSGASAIREYVVTSRPSGKTCVTKSTSCVMKGLSPGSSYAFSVVAKNASGASAVATSNRVKVATAGTYFETTIAKFGASSAAAETALETATTAAQEKKDEAALIDSFNSFVSSLSLERWPANTATDMASFVADFRQLSADTTTSLGATSTTAPADFDTLQADTNKEVLVEASVFADLGLTAPIIASIAATPSPVTVATPVTIHDFFGDDLSVTATQIVDPATAASGSGLPDAGYRFVAVELNLANQSTTNSIEGNVNYSTTAIGSDGQTYTADFGTVSECTNVNFGDFDLPSGDSGTGCVVFQLPTNVTIQTIQFSLASGYLDTAAWSG